MKKVLALMMIAAMLLLGVSCGGTPDESTPGETTTESSTIASETTSAETTASETTSSEETTASEETTSEETTKTPDVPTPTGLPEAYVDFDFSNGMIIDNKGNVTIQNNGAAIVSASVTAGDKTATVDALRVDKSGEHVLCIFNEFNTREEIEAWAEKGFTVEAFYVMGKKGSIQGVVCGTERGGWGIAEDKTGKPYFITGTGENKYNTGAYAKVPSSTTELVHVVAVYDYENKLNLIYINGELISSTSIQGAFYPGASETFNRFCLGADIKTQANPSGSGTVALDFPSPDMTMVDAKIYSAVLTAEQAAAAYENALALLD